MQIAAYCLNSLVLMRKLTVLFVLSFLWPLALLAQLPDCTVSPSSIVYIQTGGGIYNYDVTLPQSPTNPSLNTIPNGGSGLAVSNNLNNPLGPSPTFYCVIGGNYAYWDGAAWVNTGHSAGPGGYVNPGGGGNYIYNYTAGGNISRYDGTGPATVLFNIPGFGSGGPFDVVGDCDGGFYVLRTDTNGGPGFMRKYDSTATLVSSWTTTGTWSTAGGGFAIANNTVYYRNGSGFRSAPFTAPNTNLAFTALTPTTQSPSDMACCPICDPSGPTADFSISRDTICQGDCVNFTDLSSGITTSWSWSFATGVPSTSILQNPMGVCFNTAGLHTIQLVASDGSSSDTITKELLVAPAINASITGDNEICLGSSATLTAQPSGNTYVWNTNNLTQSISRSPSVNTTYQVIVSNLACTDTADFTVSINPLPSVTTSSTLTDCDVDNGTATAIAAGGTSPYTYLWSNSSATALINNLAVGSYTVIVMDSKNCTASATANVGIQPNPVAVIAPYPVASVRIGESVQLNASGGNQYSWSPSTYLNCVQCSDPLSSPKVDQMIYCVEVINNNGCKDTACTTVLVDTSCSNIFVPNAFSPNGDGLNDYISISNTCSIDKLNFSIFNRWGQKVFQSNSVLEKWDGRLNGEEQPISTFFYVLEADLINGRTIRQRGDITLVR